MLVFEAVRARLGLSLVDEMRSVLEECRDSMPRDTLAYRMVVNVLERAAREMA